MNPINRPLGNWAPDFALAGAPKSGTTSLYLALQNHPQICMSAIKEPQFFATDFPGYREVGDARTYANLFRRRNKGKICGEASTLYLHSSRAISAMLERRPDAKIIALVRDPIELFQSLHNERVKDVNENQPDPEAAWAMQAERAQGRGIPSTCSEPRLLQYRDLCLLGRQVERLIRKVPEKQRLILLFDDLKTRRDKCLRRICEFLGVSPEVHLELPRANSFATPRSIVAARLLRAAHTHPLVHPIEIHGKPLLNQIGIAPFAWLERMNLRRVPKPRLRSEFRAMLRAEFASDVDLLSRLLNANLDHWLGETPPGMAQHYAAVQPPSRVTMEPCMNSAAGDAR